MRFSPWFQCYRPVAVPAARLVCFPHAGGGASFFRPWVGSLPAGVELLSAQYPGREDRLSEPVATDLAQLATLFSNALLANTRRPTVPLVLFGHSLGAAVAYEVARRISSVLLVVSGRQAPVDRSRSVHLMTDDELWADVREAGGTSRQVLDSQELRALVLPVLRGDYRLSETYEPAPGPALTCQILACSGDRDADVDVSVLAGWGKLTETDFDIRLFPGDHFYLAQACGALIEEILRRIRSHVDGVQWPSMP